MEGRSLAETPSWAVATVISLLVGVGYLIHGGLKKFGKWLDRTKRKHLLAALNKIKEELMVFGLLSLLMGHWIIFVSKICVKSSALGNRFYPCSLHNHVRRRAFVNHALVLSSTRWNSSISRHLLGDSHEDFCPKDHQPFASYESLEQLHRLLIVLGVTHVSYSFLAIALAMIKIYSWRQWENHAKTIAFRTLLSTSTSVDSQDVSLNGARMTRPSSFIFHQTSHRWSQHRALVWLLCFCRQFWSSINQADYTALRLGFISTHQLPLTYDFHNYMLRSMEEEFRDIVGISVPLWIFAISCIVLGFHGIAATISGPVSTEYAPVVTDFVGLALQKKLTETTKKKKYNKLFDAVSKVLCFLALGTNIYFWMSFLPAILILGIGMKLHHIVVKLAVEIMDSSQWTGFDQFNLRDELFWFGNPRLLLRLIQFNAFEMAMYTWSLWQIRGPSCFTGDHSFLIIRLTFGVVSQFWCSFITFPLYVIVTQMGSKYKKTIVSENVRRSLHGWRRKVRAKQEAPFKLLTATTSIASVESIEGGYEKPYCGHSTEKIQPAEISQSLPTLEELFLATPLDESIIERY